ncbi:tetratricopeptide repeat protein [Fundidesulfovibrio putealis]|uniref:tetratricopeptide repeat protein n=1 Tax=Fundidesulfovibrio putealis TaxID=270496 RepID=UPI000412433C|nr:tetratricopeptide repeat protein [Fundidesulfovibrio putealis]
MKNRTKAVTAYAEFPMRKLVVGMMAVGITAIFLTSFITGANVPLERQAQSKKSMKSDEMAAVPALMGRVQANPKDEEALLELAELFSRTENWEKSLFFWTKALELNPDNLGGHYHRAYSLVELQRYEEAISDYEFILKVKPDAYQAHYYLGVIYKHGLNKPDLAKKHLQQALATSPKDNDLIAEINKELSDMK